MARAGLTREAVRDAALALADADGLSAVTMRRVARELGVEAMSLYNHVRSKRDLEQALIDRVWEEVDTALDETDWRAALHRIATSAHRSLVSHPWFFELPLAEGGTTRLAVIEATLSHLHRGGVPEETAFHALHIIDGHVYGYSWQAIEFAPVNAQERADELLETISSYPHLHAHARQHLGARPPGDGFTIGLDLILDGLARERSDSTTPR